jgi:hypothetical protein
MNNTLLKSEARSATTSSADQNTPAGQRGVLLTLDVTNVPAGKAAAEATKKAAEEAVVTAEEAVAAAEEGAPKEAAEAELVAAEAAQKAAEEALEAAEAAEAGTLALSLELRDPASGVYVPLTAFASTKKASELEAGVTTLAFTIYPGAVETAAVGGHEVMALPLPGKWRVKVTHSAGGDWTYTVGASKLQ